MRRAITAAALLLVCSGDAFAQGQARFSLDSTVESDIFRGQNAATRPGIVIDITGVVRIAGGWSAYVRPWFRQPRTPSWDKEIYQAALQYERHGPVSTRLNLGYIVSPVGLGLMDTRPGVNPLILPHFSYVTPMPPLEAGAPVALPIGSTYPLGGEVTVSTTKWDARAAIVNSAPARIFVVNNTSKNPASTPVIEAGAGITPKVGLRLGASFAHGNYATGDELKPAKPDGRMMTLVGLEGEYAFRYTKLTGEITRDSFETAAASATAYEWFIQGTQTLTPRVFLAARQEGTSAPPPFSGVTTVRPILKTTEATVGYRLSTEFTLRGSFFARKAFARNDWDQQAGVSIVWSHRWW